MKILSKIERKDYTGSCPELKCNHVFEEIIGGVFRCIYCGKIKPK
jgi:hypothetical protein